ncbi:MAG: carboxylating nicotinate-nucleotide diphosphorylase [Desulfovibrio sp.]|nr:MAG: carboxylating nicotinate-nucleotide diphosphorylase [Desulfovibrio sp.]
MNSTIFNDFFTSARKKHLAAAIDQALAEDGRDLTSQALFEDNDRMQAIIVAKQEAVVAGLPIAALVCERLAPQGGWSVEIHVEEGGQVEPGDTLVSLTGPAALLLKAERVMLNFITHLSGIATLTAAYTAELKGTPTKLLDTRKTLPGLRYPEKYAVLAGGGSNHRMDLEEMLMLKDNHIDRAGSITRAVEQLRAAYSPCPPIEVECRDLDEVDEAVAAGVERIMLDNMDHEAISQALARIPPTIESEVSGGVSLKTIAAIGRLGPDYVSVGRITHSAPIVDFSMRLNLASP